jgi:CRISPR-associated endoribonuclease Cas6
MGVPMDLNFVRLIFTLRLEQDARDRFVLFGIKQFFEEAFLQSSRCEGGSASLCTCTYHKTFSQSLSVDPAALKRYQKPSLPFIFQVPVLPETPNRGSVVELGLVLTGSELNFLNEYLHAVTMMLLSHRLRHKVSATLEKIESLDYGGTRFQLQQTGSDPSTGHLATMSLAGVCDSRLLPSETLSLTIISPMRLMTEGRPLREFSFPHFIRALMRRVSSMVYYSEGQESALDYKWLAERSQLVTCFSTGLQWEEWSGKWSGFAGKVTFTGDLTEFHPFLLAGEYLNLGKGATFGLGRFILERSELPL